MAKLLFVDPSCFRDHYEYEKFKKFRHIPGVMFVLKAGCKPTIYETNGDEIPIEKIGKNQFKLLDVPVDGDGKRPEEY